jgi:hypothetical protein
MEVYRCRIREHSGLTWMIFYVQVLIGFECGRLGTLGRMFLLLILTEPLASPICPDSKA